MPMSGQAFRAQLVTQGERELFDYWLRSAGAKSMPARSDLDPLMVPRLLPHLGLIDVGNGLDQASFRLAGTKLRDVYGQEITGKRLDEVFSGDRAAYWRRVHERVMRLGRPLHGVVQGPAEGRDHILLFWLRLPLSEDGGRVDRILCHDMAGPAGGKPSEGQWSLPRHACFPELTSAPRRAQAR
jgi:hypothetical protein